jgi:hypothetical protein
MYPSLILFLLRHTKILLPKTFQGLPKEHSTAISKVYADNFSRLATALKSQTLRLTKNVEIVEWNVAGDTAGDGGRFPEVDLKIRFKFVLIILS